MTTPTPGQKTIPIKDWTRFLRAADWYERTVEHPTPGVLRPTYGHATIVKTPTGGIDARDGTDLSSASCIRCVIAETTTPGEKTVHETEEELLVYNNSETDIPGDIYIQTVLTLKGTRFAITAGAAGGLWVTVMTNFRVVRSTRTLEIKTREIRVPEARDESDWTIVYTGVVCPDPESL